MVWHLIRGQKDKNRTKKKEKKIAGEGVAPEVGAKRIEIGPKKRKKLLKRMWHLK